jgi:opacity protein-like surface antigen
VDGLGGDATFNELTLNGVVNFMPGEAFEPYVTAGGGVYFTIGNVDAPGHGVFSEDSTDLGINGGAGVRFMVRENVSIGGELVYHYIFGDIDEGYLNLLATASYGFSTDY